MSRSPSVEKRPPSAEALIMKLEPVLTTRLGRPAAEGVLRDPDTGVTKYLCR